MSLISSLLPPPLGVIGDAAGEGIGEGAGEGPPVALMIVSSSFPSAVNSGNCLSPPVP